MQHWHSVREVFETPGSRHVANLLVREGLAVAAAEGVNIPSEEADHILQKVTSPTDHPDLLSLHIDYITYLASILTMHTDLYCGQVIASRQENKTSMCVDVLKKRQSEVDFINGRVVALAKK